MLAPLTNPPNAAKPAKPAAANGERVPLLLKVCSGIARRRDRYSVARSSRLYAGLYRRQLGLSAVRLRIIYYAWQKAGRSLAALRLHWRPANRVSVDILRAFIKFAARADAPSFRRLYELFCARERNRTRRPLPSCSRLARVFPASKCRQLQECRQLIRDGEARLARLTLQFLTEAESLRVRRPRPPEWEI